MSKFAIRLIVFCLPFILIMYFPHFTNVIFDNELDMKFRTFMPDPSAVNIVIAGDSRAERALIPKIFEDRTGLETTNIAKGVCDLMTLYKAFEKYDLAQSEQLFVVSASIWQANDGAVDKGYISINELMEIPVWGQILMLHGEYFASVENRLKLFWEEITGKRKHYNFKQDDIRLRTQGFLGVDSILNPETITNVSLNPDSTQHYFYKRLNINGYRKQVIQKALKLLSKTKSKFLIYQPPASPLWHYHTKDSFIDKAEREYSTFLENEIDAYENIQFIDFYEYQNPKLDDSKFYDLQHVNITGAEIFTSIVIDSLITRQMIDKGDF
ncbi:hypothetical protein ACFL46_00565 [Candidatus Neomarinimicrobiota bacterium]